MCCALAGAHALSAITGHFTGSPTRVLVTIQQGQSGQETLKWVSEILDRPGQKEINLRLCYTQKRCKVGTEKDKQFPLLRHYNEGYHNP